MKSIKLSEDIVLEISEGDEIFKISEKIIDLKLYVPRFTMRSTLSGLNLYLKERSDFKDKISHSFLCLIKKGEEYIGCCNFMLFHPCTIQTYIKDEYRGKGTAFHVIKVLIEYIKKNDEINNTQLFKNVKFYHGEMNSYCLFYKLWVNNVISLNNILDYECQKILLKMKDDFEKGCSSSTIEDVNNYINKKLEATT